MRQKLRSYSYRNYLEWPVLGPVVDGFVHWLQDRGYAVHTIRRQLGDCREIGDFLLRKGVTSWQGLTPDLLDAAYRHLNHRCPCRGSTVRWLEKYLICEHALPRRPPVSLTRSGDELMRYVGHLSKVMGLSAGTVCSHQACVSRFLEFIDFQGDANALHTLTSKDIDSFIGVCSRTRNRHSLQNAIGCIRTFLRFEFTRGELPSPLHLRIDSPRIYRHEKLPKSVPWSTVESFLAAIDRRDGLSKRNYAMLLLMATYGLRAIEVVSLVLDDIDWHRKTIHIRQDKTNKHLLLPLTDGIAEVLIDYLKTARPQVSHREVFLRAYAPIGRLDHSAVAKAFEREARLVGLDIPFRGTHYLRHSFAVHLLRQGASLKSIGDILGHRDAESTCVYLRLAVEDLRVVALEVPDDQPRDPGVAAVSVDKLPHYKLPARSTPPGPLRSSFGPQIGAYLELHHSLGKRFRSPERILRSLDYFLSVYSPEETALSHYSFNRWCNTLTDYMAKDRRSRMGIVRKFCLYLQRSQPDTFIPDILTFPSGQPKPSPFIVYPDGIGQVLHAIRSITPNSRYPSVREIMRLSVVLLFTTGIRRGELLRLRLADFNPAEATLFIRTTKFYKERVVPVSVTTVQEIEDYLVHCRQAGFDMSAELPLIRNGNPRSRMCYTGCGLGRHWRRVCASLGLLSQRGIPPRLHDLRHSFAVNALLRSYENGGEPQAILPQLSTYMGHGSVTSTYHYLAFVDPLRAVASARFEEKYGSLASQRSDVPVIQQESDNE